MWHLELHSLFDFLHEQRLLRHVLQWHLLYLWPPNSDAFPAHSLNEILTDGMSAMLTVPYVHVLNWFLAYHEFSIPCLVPIPYNSLLCSASIITPKIFLESHLPQSTSSTQTFTVSSTFPSGNFSLASLVVLMACICRLLFTVFLFSVILFFRWAHIDGDRGISVTISVDDTSSSHVSSWSSNTDPSASAIPDKSFSSTIGSSVGSFCSSPS